MYKVLELDELKDLCDKLESDILTEQNIKDVDLLTIIHSVLNLDNESEKQAEEIERLENEIDDKENDIDNLRDALTDIYDKVKGYINDHEETNNEIYSIAKDALK